MDILQINSDKSVTIVGRHATSFFHNKMEQSSEGFLRFVKLNYPYMMYKKNYYRYVNGTYEWVESLKIGSALADKPVSANCDLVVVIDINEEITEY